MATVLSLGLIECPPARCRKHEPETERLIRLIRAGDAAGAARLCAMLEGGIRFFLKRSLGSACANDVQAVLLRVLQTIRRGDLSNPDELIPFALATVKDQILARAREERDEHHCQAARESAENAAMGRVLQEILPREREILVRFYLHRQTPAQIMKDLNITPAEFRSAKTRARIRFAELEAAKPVERKPVGRVTSRDAVALCL